MRAKIRPCDIQSSEQQKVPIDNKLTFDKYINNLCSKASQKLNALCRLSSFMSTNKRWLVIKAFISYQFSYCLLIWIHHSQTLNNKINRTHEKSIRVVYNDKKVTFKELLDKDKAVSIDTRNLEILVTDRFSVKIGELPSIMHEVFLIDNSNRPSKIACTVTNVHVTCTQTALRVQGNSCTLLIPLCKNNLNLLMSHTDHYDLRK